MSSAESEFVVAFLALNVARRPTTASAIASRYSSAASVELGYGTAPVALVVAPLGVAFQTALEAAPAFEA